MLSILPDNFPYYRIEPRSRTDSFDAGLAMRVADPLWMLGRQWQFGEFQAEDTASPVNVSVKYRCKKIDYYQAGMKGEYSRIDAPLEGIVESMEIPLEFDWKNRVRVGQHLERMLTPRIVKQLRQDYPLQVPEDDGKRMDKKTKRFVSRMAGRVIDGYKVWEAGARLKPKVGEEIYNSFRLWYKRLYLQTENSSWNPKKLQHEFAVADKKDPTKDGVSLDAGNYESGHLDWYSFDRAIMKGTISRSTKTFPGTEDDFEVIANGVRYPGMPRKRLFELEDSRVDFGRVEASAANLAQLMLIEFGLGTSNDWFQVPLELPLGTLSWIEEIVVTDAFGGKITQKHKANEKDHHLGGSTDQVFDLFKVKPTGAENGKFEELQQFLFVPPVVPHKQSSAPLEEVWFLRDEYSNLVWAKEETVFSPLGRPVNGFDQQLELYPEPEKKIVEAGEIPVFRLAVSPPRHWFPYMLTDTANEQLLKRAEVFDVETNSLTLIKPLTILAYESDQVRLEEIPRAGLRLRLTKQRVRWTDGGTYVWLGRDVAAGAGEGGSGVRFDVKY